MGFYRATYKLNGGDSNAAYGTMVEGRDTAALPALVVLATGMQYFSGGSSEGRTFSIYAFGSNLDSTLSCS